MGLEQDSGSVRLSKTLAVKHAAGLIPHLHAQGQPKVLRIVIAFVAGLGVGVHEVQLVHNHSAENANLKSQSLVDQKDWQKGKIA